MRSPGVLYSDNVVSEVSSSCSVCSYSTDPSPILLLSKSWVLQFWGWRGQF